MNRVLVFLDVAIISAMPGFTGIAGAAAGIAKILFVIFLVIFILSIIFGRRAVWDMPSVRPGALTHRRVMRTLYA